HPHTDLLGRIALIHNGIIENAGAIRTLLEKRGHTFRSETDTEVLAHLVGSLYQGDLEEAVAAALREVDGAYGIAVVCSDEPDVLVAARKGSPLIVGVGDGEWFVASDASALLEHTRSVIYLDDGEMVVLNRQGYRVRDLQVRKISKAVDQIEWDLDTIERGGYEHFMLKEIFEQPESLANTLRGHLLDEEGTARVTGINLTDEELGQFDRVVITACGTSWHSALIGEYMLEELARIPVEVEYASEFRYRNPVVDARTLVIGISQSGETADTLAAIREAKQRGARTLGLVNVVGSTIAREVHGGIYLHAGPEVGVASTKAFTSQVAALALITLRIARRRSMSILQGRQFIQALRALPDQIRQILAKADEVKRLAELFTGKSNALYLGRGVNFPVALEGALKLKEISYIHAEGYPAAEMKHGPIALIDENMPVVVIAPRDAVHAKIVSNIEEVRARGGRVIAVTSDGDGEIHRLAEATFTIPETLDLLTPILSVIPLQLFSYYVAVARGCNVDQPRNLAKSVTVE
ncbi:MAG TPA: glutamine--fructose-6-phosphate transaminase (isomerizing), partial [Gemmatimonadales bacterium]|nr:glutamine--fructose-6-phosphate transaminase (isomerizing) [Gemmatimonadales bacterium]